MVDNYASTIDNWSSCPGSSVSLIVIGNALRLLRKLMD
jgi:hypothetical protein